MDIKNAYLNGELDVELYIEQPLFFEEKDREKYVCRLKKGLYGLKQAGRIWNEILHNFLISKGYKALDSEPSIYIKKIEKNIVIITIYIDDLPILANNPVVLEEAKQELKDRFKMNDLGKAHHLLELRIIRKEGRISIDQGHYTEKILKKYQMIDCNPIEIPLSKDLKLRILRKDEEIVNEKEYKSVVGALNYLTVMTRSDITIAVGIVSRYIQKSEKIHWLAVKRILRYLKGTVDYGLVFEKRNRDICLEAYYDADYAGCLDDRKFISGYMLLLERTVVNWKSIKQEYT